jgi:hypothetical protein
MAEKCDDPIFASTFLLAELKLSQFCQQGFHLRLGVQISGAAGGGDAVSEHGFGFGNSVGADQGLGCHEVAGSVVGSGLKKDGEFGERSIEVTLLGVFHRKAVAGKGVAGILREDVVERGYAVHKAVVSDQWPARIGQLRLRLLHIATTLRVPYGLLLLR